MVMAEKLSLSEFVSRRLNPVKVTIDLMKHEARSASGGKVEMPVHLMGAILTTLELFVEDYERLIHSQSPRSAADRRMVTEDQKV
jgi:hypothetical protein